MIGITFKSVGPFTIKKTLKIRGKLLKQILKIKLFKGLEFTVALVDFEKISFEHSLIPLDYINDWSSSMIHQNEKILKKLGYVSLRKNTGSEFYPHDLKITLKGKWAVHMYLIQEAWKAHKEKHSLKLSGLKNSDIIKLKLIKYVRLFFTL